MADFFPLAPVYEAVTEKFPVVGGHLAPWGMYPYHQLQNMYEEITHPQGRPMEQKHLLELLDIQQYLKAKKDGQENAFTRKIERFIKDKTLYTETKKSIVQTRTQTGSLASVPPEISGSSKKQKPPKLSISPQVPQKPREIPAWVLGLLSLGGLITLYFFTHKTKK
jgi:hypothetical protein